MCYLVFQLFSHKQLYEDDYFDIMKSTKYAPNVQIRFLSRSEKPPMNATEVLESSTIVLTPASLNNQDVTTEPPAITAVLREEPVQTEREDEEEQPSMSLPFTIALLVAVTAVRPSVLGVIVNKLTLP